MLPVLNSQLIAELRVVIRNINLTSHCCARKRVELEYYSIIVFRLLPGEVSDSNEDSTDNAEEFDDGYDENLIGDAEDKRRLEQMTEKEREQEIFNRLEKREMMRTRY